MASETSGAGQHLGTAANSTSIKPRRRLGSDQRQSSTEDEIADAQQELQVLCQQIDLTQAQLEAWRETRLRNGEGLQTYEERKLISSLELFSLQEKNIRAWIDRQGHRPDDGRGGMSGQTKDKFGPHKPDAGRKKSKNRKNGQSKTEKSRARRSAGKKKVVVARDSPSRGISRRTGKRSRVRLIG